MAHWLNNVKISEQEPSSPASESFSPAPYWICHCPLLSL